MDYELKSGEKLNGGYMVKIGGFTLMNIGAYSPSWRSVYDDENNFTDYLGNTQKILKGKQFSLKISTGRLSAEDFKALAAELNKESITVECPDFTGECYCDDIPGSLEQANFYGTRYKLNFTLNAKEIVIAGGGL
ncbi:MAG: hypothetical protein J6C96_05625 [Oscillospiraceae bacterium]|nr:hypothetical protein [Oscillospiraceae bacterium]